MTAASSPKQPRTIRAHTELEHLDLFMAACAAEVDDDWAMRFDTSRVQAL
ncbi:hypothetical protein [Streptomyces wuyuanensis]